MFRKPATVFTTASSMALLAGSRAGPSGRSPNPMNWTAELAFGMALAGHPEAVVHARQSLREAQQIGGRRDLAEAQRVCAMTGDRGTAALAKAAGDAFRTLGARLEECRTHLAYGASPDVAGTPGQQQAYEEGLRLAQRCAATRLAVLARIRLRSIGARPKIRPVTGFGALTAGERRVVTLAAAGRRNKEIAQDLFVTVKTVETHLAHAYQKLQITSRRALAGMVS